MWARNRQMRFGRLGSREERKARRGRTALPPQPVRAATAGSAAAGAPRTSPPAGTVVPAISCQEEQQLPLEAKELKLLVHVGEHLVEIKGMTRHFACSGRKTR
jgi:hypothetical protein